MRLQVIISRLFNTLEMFDTYPVLIGIACRNQIQHPNKILFPVMKVDVLFNILLYTMITHIQTSLSKLTWLQNLFN